MRYVVKETLRKAFEGGMKVTVESEIDDDIEVYHCFIVGLTEDFACLFLLSDWHYDGIQIVPVEFITGLESGEFEATYHRILDKEGVLPNIKIPSWLDLTNLESITRSIKENHNNLMIESRMESSDEYVIGKITEIEKDSLTLKGYDANARWEDGSYEIPFSEITSIKFDDEYTNIMVKHIS